MFSYSMIAIISGSMMYESDILQGFEETSVDTAYGWVFLMVNREKNAVFLQRHGKKRNIPPHKINHIANIAALKELGVKKIFSISSTGSLKKDIPPGSIVIPDDYIDFFSKSTIYDDKIVHVTPEISEELRQELTEAASEAGIKVISHGIHLQTTGPRLETKAEVQILKRFGDVVGMTFGSEATIANEFGIPIANIASVDNYANGIQGTINEKDIEAARRKNFKNIEMMLRVLLR